MAVSKGEHTVICLLSSGLVWRPEPSMIQFSTQINDHFCREICRNGQRIGRCLHYLSTRKSNLLTQELL